MIKKKYMSINWKNQFKNNEVGIISLVIAIIALFHTTWLYNHSEKNRNIRVASFEVLLHLGELQQVVNTIHYQHNTSIDIISQGWGHLSLIGDLSMLIPHPVPDDSKELINAWKQNLDKLSDSEESATQISDKIDKLRQAIVKIITNL